MWTKAELVQFIIERERKLIGLSWSANARSTTYPYPRHHHGQGNLHPRTRHTCSRCIVRLWRPKPAASAFR